ncbi:hypothetical protein NVP1210O_10 [Vibrio phage 1.210.O._10N.222.52.C2]|nr:hypothetical protein NVP1210O_10 [Vibrio phage 1.210.O._10N.222.52.C2]
MIKILVLDDNKVNKAAVMAALSQAGHDVVLLSGNANKQPKKVIIPSCPVGLQPKLQPKIYSNEIGRQNKSDRKRNRANRWR